MDSLYLSLPLVNCFDDDPPANDPPDTGDVEFTPEQQEKMNQIYAREKRKHQDRIHALETQLAKFQEQQQEFEDFRQQHLTDEERREEEISKANKRAEAAEGKYRSTRINTSLKDAASAGDAFNSEQVVNLLIGKTTLNDADEVVIEWDGESLSPSDVITRMKASPEQWGNLFKSNSSGGLGSNSATGVTPGKDGKVDLATLARLDPVAYRKARKENPELFS